MTADQPPAGTLRRLKRRSEFLKAARGKRAGRSSFALQAVANRTGDAGVGFTVTKKVGNAPERNRIKRRLRAAVALAARDFAPGNDYVLVGRRGALHEPFAALLGDLRKAIARVGETGTPSSTRHGTPGGHRNTRQ